MANLSTPPGELRARYDVVVIGSGYGGSVVARRLAEAHPNGPLSVCLFERGLEITPGGYPVTLLDALLATQAETRSRHMGRRTALLDLRLDQSTTVLLGCGLGGGSLINASVMSRPKPFDNPVWPEALKKRWPTSLHAPGALERCFEFVISELGAASLPADVALDKFGCLLKAAEAKDSSQHRPRIAVTFHTHVNQFGVQQARCTLCGNCMTGCNYSAKNTLIMNYLPAAAEAGASIFCGVKVTVVEPCGDEWLVHAHFMNKASRVFDAPAIRVKAGAVFLAAGTLGSTEILLRSKERFQLSLSPTLGQHFSGNGDVLAFGYDLGTRVTGVGYGARLPTFAAVGPTITGMLDERSSTQSGAMIQEGAVPGALKGLLRIAGPVIAWLGRVPGEPTGFSLSRLWRQADSLLRGSRHGALTRTQTYLAMSLDDGAGEMYLHGDRLRIRWPGVLNQEALKKAGRRLVALTKHLHGSHVDPNRPKLFRSGQFIAHPLGGCAMADSSEHGVVNDVGQVYEHVDSQASSGSDGKPAVYKGLYVCDGSIVPTALGTNPALTISALAERISRRAKRRLRSRTEPPTAVRVDPTRPGLTYGEHLSGSVRLFDQDTRIHLHLHLSVEDVERLMTDVRKRVSIDDQKRLELAQLTGFAPGGVPDKSPRADQSNEIQVVGSALMPDLADPDNRRFTISEGRLHLLVDDDRSVDTKLLIYRLRLTSGSGKTTVWLRGHKVINYESCKRGLWNAATHLPFVLLDHDDTDTAPEPLFPYASCRLVDKWVEDLENPDVFLSRRTGVRGAGSAGSGVADALRLARSIEVHHERRITGRFSIALRFFWLFIDALIQARVWALRRTVAFDPLHRDVEGVPPKNKGKEARFPPPGQGKTRYILTRYMPVYPARPPGCGRPLILIPGFSMSTYWFRAQMPNHQRNTTQYLLDQGYEVWLLDYRASNRVESSFDQFTLDELAETDFPNAFAEVFARTGQPAQVIAHCVGSITTLMSLLKGRIAKKHVHSIVLSQSLIFIDMPFVNRFKAWLRAAQTLRFLGFRPVLSTQFDLTSSLAERFLDRLLYFYPSRERCHSGVCRRLLLIYGEANRHVNLDRLTHDKLYDMEDAGNLTTVTQLQKMALKHRIVDADGRNTYVTEANTKNIKLPITLLQGTNNNLFRRSGAHKTLEWLRKHGDCGNHDPNKFFTLQELPGFGHMDVFIGKASADDVYPKIDKALTDMRGMTP